MFLEARTEEIIQEAKVASTAFSDASVSVSSVADTARKQQIIHDALSSSRKSNTVLLEEDFTKPFQLRSTKEVLQLASSVLKVATNSPTGSTLSSLRVVLQEDENGVSAETIMIPNEVPSDSLLLSFSDDGSSDQATENEPTPASRELLNRMDGVRSTLSKFDNTDEDSDSILAEEATSTASPASPAFSILNYLWGGQSEPIKDVPKSPKNGDHNNHLSPKRKLPTSNNPRIEDEEEAQDMFGAMSMACGTSATRQIDDPRDPMNSNPFYHHDSFSSITAPFPFAKPAPAGPKFVAVFPVGPEAPPPPPSYAETIASSNNAKFDPRMPVWIQGQHYHQENRRLSKPRRRLAALEDDPRYTLGASRTVIVHQIMRGNWTWCTEWSPDGTRLAIATENHQLAVVDTHSSPVWRVRYDKKIKEPPKKDTTHSIRSIAWGSQFIAIGGSGNAVTILAPTEPYPILHTIRGTGFCGSMQWRLDTAVLVIGSRNDTAIIVKVSASDSKDDETAATAAATTSTVAAASPPHVLETVASPGRHIQSTVLHTITRTDWVNAVSFSPSGLNLAVGDRKGCLAVYNYEENPKQPVKVTEITAFAMEDSILDVEWSADGKWLYAGGEDFTISVIMTSSWELVHKIQRDRWVQFMASSHSGTHLAVGGDKSEVSILEVDSGWKTVMSVELKGLVPLSGKWHPKDQYLALTGQDDSILAIETTNARHVQGHYLKSISPILAIEFSPDGRMAVIGNEAGVITFFALSGTTFVTKYELVLSKSSHLSIEWSPNGSFVLIGTCDSLIVVDRNIGDRSQFPSNIPPGSSGFSIRKVIREYGAVHTVSIDLLSQYIAISGDKTRVLDAADEFRVVREWSARKTVLANAWSPDGRWMATIGQGQTLTIYDTRHASVRNWRVIFTLQVPHKGLALAWGPMIVDGLLYLAYGGDDRKVTIMEIRTNEETWETVLEIPRDDVVQDLDWTRHGLLAAAIGNGTVSIIDLAYLQSGWAVNEMDYNWQRQALTCFTEIRRNQGVNSMKTVRWLPSPAGSDSLLAIGGTDGALEIVDLTERQNCRGYARNNA